MWSAESRTRRVATVAAASVAVGSLVFAAVTSEGYRTTAAELHDGTVWTINSDRASVMRINARVNEFDTQVRAETKVSELYQDGTSVYLHTPGGLTALNSIGTNIATPQEPLALPVGSQIGAGGGTAALLTPDGGLFVTPSRALGGVDPTQVEPTIGVGAGSQLSVTPEGLVVVLDSRDDEVIVVDPKPDAEPGEEIYEIREALPFGFDLAAPGEGADDFTFAAVGDTAAVLQDGDLLIEGLESPVTGAFDQYVVLQEPGVAAQQAAVADGSGLYAVDLSSGDVSTIFDGVPDLAGVGGVRGPAAAPAVVGGCIYAGWEQVRLVWRRCGEDGVPFVVPDGEEAGTNWRFRVNRTQVVLEADGADPRHITDDGLVVINNWEDFDSDREEEDENQTEETPDDKEQAVCSDSPAPPEANDDTFGATPGVSLTLRVLDNDRDPNCDPMAIQPLEDWNDAWGQIALIDQRQAFQYTPPPEDPVSFTFTYTVDDGRGGEASATVSVKSGGGQNRPPKLRQEGVPSETIVELFKTVTYNVLLDWVDPDGDTLILEGAALQFPSEDGDLIWSKDGTITYTATDTVAGPKEIALSISDGRDGGRVDGILNISVQGEGVPLPPTARDDYIEAPAGREVLLQPLVNDTDPNNDQLLLGAYEPPEDVRVKQRENSTLALSADEPGTYLIPYEATDGDLSDSATIRFEVTEPDQEQRPPVAVRDSIVLREGQSLNVDVLANDYDPDGDVLLVTDVRLKQVGLPGISVSAVDRRFVRVQVDQDPEQPLIIEYLVTDGFSAEQVGQLVVNVTPKVGDQRPVTNTDQVRVRVNDTVDIAVLANDVDPDGDILRVVSAELNPEDQPGFLWLDGSTARYRAGEEPGIVTARYTVQAEGDATGLETSSGFIEITVLDSSPDKNQAPIPPPLEARVFAGAEVLIPLPLNGLDPDGDSVDIVEIGGSGPDRRPPSLGVPEIRRRGILYRANEGVQGQDEFTYEVEDAFGATAVGTVRVVVFDAPNHPPVLVPDLLVVRPDRTLQIPVLSNDSDPDGDALSLDGVDGPVELQTIVNESRVQVEVPSAPAEGEGVQRWQLIYEASDGRGATRSQTVTIIADPEAPLLPPVARDDPDDLADELELVEQPDGTYSTTVELISNDDDPDGSRADLVIGLPAGQGVDAALQTDLAVDASGDGEQRPTGLVDVVLTDRPQSFVYSVTDFDGLVSYAVVSVPRAPVPNEDEVEVNRPPELRDDPEPVTIVQGEEGRIVVSEYVIDPDGDEVTLAGATPRSSQGEAGVTEGDFGSFTFTPALNVEGTQVTVFVDVTDRPGDPEYTVQLPFPVIVEKPNQPPNADAFSVDVEQLGDAPPVSLVEAGAVTDPEDDPLSFRLLEGSVDGINFSLSADGEVSVSVAEGTPEGVSATYRYSVTDGQPDRKVEGSVTVNVVASTKPLVVLTPQTVEDIRQGEAHTVTPLTGVANPFPEQPLEIIEADLVDGAGSVTTDGTNITFTPPDDYFGSAQVRYTVQDGTRSASRHVSSTVTYTVIGRPLAPGQPRVLDVYSHTVVLEWAPADPQGTPITDYAVSWSGGEITTGGATNITIDTLTNDTPYTFTVTATNEVGTSEPSAASGEAIPDEIPTTPAAPLVVDFGDGTLSVEWTEPPVDGSAIFQYDVSVSGGETRTFPASVLSTAWDGLTNGTEYTFTVVAENNAGRSDVSSLSNALSPAREPEAPGQASVTDVGNELVAQALVEWSQPANNGRDIDYYEIVASPGGDTYTSSVESITVQVPPGQDTTFTVRAHNVVGFSTSSPASSTFESIVAPTAPAAPSATVGDRSISVTSPAPSTDGGDPITRYEYSLNSGGWTAFTSGNSTSIGGLTNGSTYDVKVRACNKKFCGPASAATGNLVPYGPPKSSQVSISGTEGGWNSSGQAVTWTWNATGAGNGRPLTYTISGSGVSSSSGSGSSSQRYPENSGNHTVTIRVSDGQGNTADVVKSATVNTGAGPRPSVSIGLGPKTTTAACPGGALQGCYYVRISISGLFSSKPVRCYGRTNSGWSLYESFNAGNGTYNRCSYSYAGRAVIVAVDGTISGGPNSPVFSGAGARSNQYGPWPTD